VRGVASVTHGRIYVRPESLSFHLKHHTFDEIIVTQTLEPVSDGGFWITPEHRLPPNYVLEKIAERRIGTKLRRMSLLKEIKADAAPPEKVSSNP